MPADGGLPDTGAHRRKHSAGDGKPEAAPPAGADQRGSGRNRRGDNAARNFIGGGCTDVSGKTKGDPGMKEIVVYVHGKGGTAAEAGYYGPLLPDAAAPLRSLHAPSEAENPCG